MDPATIATVLVAVALLVGYFAGQRRNLHELRYQRRMAEQWYVAYRTARLKAQDRDGGEWWQRGDPCPEYDDGE